MPEETDIQDVDVVDVDNEAEPLSDDEKLAITLGTFAIAGFKYVNEKATVKFQLAMSNGMVTTFTIESSQLAPHIELLKTLDELAEDLAREAEVPFGKENPITVTQFLVKTNGEKSAYRIFGLYGRENSRNAMNISSDLKWNEHPDDLQVLNAETVYKIERAAEQAHIYVQKHLEPAEGYTPNMFDPNKKVPSLLQQAGIAVTADAPF